MRLINLGPYLLVSIICLLIFSCSKNSAIPNQTVVSTFAGSGIYGILDGVDTAARFANPYDAAMDGNGNFYVSEVATNCIRKITPSGVVSTIACSGSAGYA